LDEFNLKMLLQNCTLTVLVHHENAFEKVTKSSVRLQSLLSPPVDLVGKLGQESITTALVGV
jgi:hypothetical protein